jgi:hypothetical protein
LNTKTGTFGNEHVGVHKCLFRSRLFRVFGALIPILLLVVGCGGGISTATQLNSNAHTASATFSVSPGAGAIDTNCAGCNNGSYELFSAKLPNGSAAQVSWSLPTGGNFGTINSATGQYTPPAYLTADSLKVTVTATLTSDTSVKASAALTVTPGFLQPLSPENFAAGANGSVQLTGIIAEAGGSTGIDFALANSISGSSGGLGTLSTPSCTRSNQAFTSCTATYTAPAAVTATGTTYIVATVNGAQTRTSSVVLLNAEGVNSSPATHQKQQISGIALGSSGGNNNDYDTRNGSIKDCCGGTLGALVQNASGTQFLLSNNHVLARTDQAAVGEAIVQPGLIEDSCTPYPAGASTPVATLTGWVPIKSAATNVDAAIAQVNSGAVNPSGAILELGAKQANGTLAAAPPGISSTAGKGELAAVGMTAVKSGRTTGLTCANVSTVSLDVQVSYYSDCAETNAYYAKTFTNQIGVTGNQFSDAGDSGALIVDAANAEPIGLFFAGGITSNGVSEGVANPAPEVLSELSTNVGNGTSYTFVGGNDHPVSCLNYGNATLTAAQAVTVSDAEQVKAEQALTQARTLVNASAGIYGVATGKSSDHAGEATVIMYVDPNGSAKIPPTIGGVRTTVIPASAQSVMLGRAPQSLLEAGTTAAVSGAALRQAITTKQQMAHSLMSQNPVFFGVGVGQSFDNPKEAALVVYVDQRSVPAQLPAMVGGLRVRYVIMDRLHVTKAYLSGTPSQSHCLPKAVPVQSSSPDFIHAYRQLTIF